MSTAPRASVLIPVLDEAQHIRETSAAMLAQELDGEVEFLFVDGGSSDGTLEVLQELAASDPRVRVLANLQRTVPHALNIGLAVARGEYVARMDAHSWYPPDYLARGIERLGRGDVTWVTGPALPRAAGGWARWTALALGSPLGQGGSRKWTDAADSPDGIGVGTRLGGHVAARATPEVDLDTGVFGGVWRRETLEAIGGWDGEWTVNEDAEMAGRVLGDGGRIVCVGAMAAHYAPRDTGAGLWRQYWRFGFFRVRTSRRHPVALRPQHLASAALAALPVVAVATPHAARRAARAGLAAYAAGLVASAASTDGVDGPRDAAGVAAALATMHLSWGSGFLAGCARFGPPWKALAQVVAGPRRSS